ncbi:hypothetical protein B0H34DRAFT_679133 [Crassisporium funariophilum]|nr:hypothetical protein B0H34DRAFT_679133 [Crassisporium funariophilum]
MNVAWGLATYLVNPGGAGGLFNTQPCLMWQERDNSKGVLQAGCRLMGRAEEERVALSMFGDGGKRRQRHPPSSMLFDGQSKGVRDGIEPWWCCAPWWIRRRREGEGRW